MLSLSKFINNSNHLDLKIVCNYNWPFLELFWLMIRYRARCFFNWMRDIAFEENASSSLGKTIRIWTFQILGNLMSHITVDTSEILQIHYSYWVFRTPKHQSKTRIKFSHIEDMFHSLDAYNLLKFSKFLLQQVQVSNFSLDSIFFMLIKMGTKKKKKNKRNINIIRTRTDKQDRKGKNWIKKQQRKTVSNYILKHIQGTQKPNTKYNIITYEQFTIYNVIELEKKKSTMSLSLRGYFDRSLLVRHHI